MENIQGVLLLVAYCLLVYYTVKGGNLILGFLLSAIAWVVIGRVPYAVAMSDVFQKAVDIYGPTAIVIMLGSWFGRVLVETGIAGSIIRRAVELGGDKILVTTILASVATTFIFTGTYGVGAVIAIGVIVLPILLSLGVSERIATAAYTMSIGAAMFINIALFKQIALFFPANSVPYAGAYFTFALMAMGVSVFFIILMLAFNLRNGAAKAWAAPVIEAPTVTHVPFYSYIVPLVPVIMAVGFNWGPVPGMFLAIFLSLLLTGQLRNLQNAQSLTLKALRDGVADVALLLGMLFTLAMFWAAAGKNAELIKAVLGPIVPSNPWIIAIIFGIVAPLGLFRGPLMPWGAGSATIAVLVAMGFFKPTLLLPLILAPGIGMAMSMCPTQSWNLWAISFTKVGITDFLKTGVPWAWMASFANALLAVYLFQ